MKIVHVNFSLETGGIETMLVDILNEQCRLAETHLILINDQIDEALLARVDSRVTLWRMGRPRGSRNPMYLAKLNALLLRLRPDAVHCHHHQVARWLWAGRANRCLTIHDVQIPTGHFGRYHKLFAISETVRQDVLQRSSFSAHRIYNGIPTDHIQPRTMGAGEGLFRIVQISRLMHEKKGQHVLLSALRQLVYQDGMTQLRVDFVGEGASRTYLEELTRSWQLTDYVTFAGLKTRQDIYGELKNYHLLVQPSFYEGFGLTVAEGMAANVPVLVSAIDGPMELIDNERFGYSFPVGDVDQLAGCIRSLVLSYGSAAVQTKVREARRHVQTHFDVRQTARQYLAQYL